jgi:hypothetical protein
MEDQNVSSWKSFQQKLLSRRDLVRGAAGAMVGAGFLKSKLVYASVDQDDSEPAACVGPNPIPGGVTGLAPYGIFVHHNPLNAAIPLANMSDPSQITDFDGFVGSTHIFGGGTGTDKTTGLNARLAFKADMGFSQGTFVGTDGQRHRGTFAFV